MAKQNQVPTPPSNPSFADDLVYWLGLLLVVVGLLNVTPSIPGWDDLWRSITGIENFKIRRFPSEWLYPITFFWMMLIVALKHSMWRSWPDKNALTRRLGLFLDFALVFAAAIISLSYLTELEAVCLIDVIKGDRAALVAQALQADIEYAEMLGLPIPDSADDPACQSTTFGWLPIILFGSIIVFLLYNIKVWGLPLVLVSLLIATYTFATVMNWYFNGADGQNKYLITILSSEEPRSLSSGREFVRDALINNTSGILGRFINILLLLVFPYIILGGLFGRCAGGQALIKLAFSLTRNLRGGPAHAAVVSSAMFGTITGGPVVNVLSTPMMLKRGFSKVFAGGVEAAASSGGSIMPPIMGVAAFVMAAMTGVPYREIIIAAIIPAIFYFFCLFLSVVFQARKQNIQAVGAMTDDMRLTGEDRLHLLQIFAPILLVLVLLLTPKDAVGCSWLSVLLGSVVERNGDVCNIESMPWIVQLFQNAAGDASAAGWWAVILLLFLMLLDKEIRSKPQKIFAGLSQAGVTLSTLYLMFLAVTVIDVCLTFTGLSKFIAVDVLGYLKSFDVSVSSAGFQLFALFLTMLLAVLLGMGMPAVPAYINVALLMGVMFTLPFVFATYPELLIIDKAVIDPETGLFLAGYDGTVDWPWLGFLFVRLALALYLVSSALSAYDHKALNAFEIFIRLAIAVLIMFKPAAVYAPAMIGAVLFIGFHIMRSRATVQTA